MRTPSAIQQEKFRNIVQAQKVWACGLPEESLDAINSYQGAGWRELNAALRHQRSLTGEAAEDHYHLQRLFQEAPPLEEALLLSRATQRDEAMDFGFTPEDVTKAYAGDPIIDRGYLSTGANLLRLGPTEQQISLLL